MSQKSLYEFLHDQYSYNQIWADADDEPTQLTNKQLRDKYPSLQNAWQQYQIVLQLVKESENGNT